MFNPYLENKSTKICMFVPAHAFHCSLLFPTGLYYGLKNVLYAIPPDFSIPSPYLGGSKEYFDRCGV